MTITNTKGTKAVNIITDNGYDTPIYRALFVQIYNGQEQVLDTKDYKSLKMAKNWAAKKLN